nr:lipocalin-15-like isoform X1 [Pogona vitticeps]
MSYGRERKKWKMELYVLWLSFAFLRAAQAVSYDSDRCSPKQAFGDWLMHAFATDCKWFMKYLDDMTMVVVNLRETESGGIYIASKFPTPFGCQSLELEFKRQEDGSYVHTSGWGEEKIEKIMTDCDTYTIVTIAKVRGGVTSRYAVLYARETQVRKEAEQKFLDYVHHELGFKEENIQMFGDEGSSEDSALLAVGLEVSMVSSSGLRARF